MDETADKLTLQESDAPQPTPAVLLVDLSSNRSSDLAHEPSGTRPGPHQPAHGGGRAELGGDSSARGDLLRFKDLFSQRARRDVQGAATGPRSTALSSNRPG